MSSLSRLIIKRVFRNKYHPSPLGGINAIGIERLRRQECQIACFFFNLMNTHTHTRMTEPDCAVMRNSQSHTHTHTHVAFDQRFS